MVIHDYTNGLEGNVLVAICLRRTHGHGLANCKLLICHGQEVQLGLNRDSKLGDGQVG